MILHGVCTKITGLLFVIFKFPGWRWGKIMEFFYSVKRRYWTKLLLGMVQCIYSYRNIFSIFSGVIYFFHAFVLKGSV